MLGEDVNSCLSVRARQKGTNRGLLSFLVHGNTRVLGAKDNSGKCISRSIARLLVDDVTGLPVVYVDTPYGDLFDPSSGQARGSLLEICDQAGKIGRLLQVPVVYSTPPPEADYTMGHLEILATSCGKENLVNLTDYSVLSTHQWIDGLTFPGEYLIIGIFYAPCSHLHFFTFRSI